MFSRRNDRLAAAAALLAFAGFAAFAQYRHHNLQDLRNRAEALTGGSVQKGEEAFLRHGCGGCHALRYVPQASGKVGPPLDGVALRAIIGGRLENKPENLERWIADPQGVSPGTAMPNLGVSESEARDIAAFLYTRT
jgi:cytochrome c2